MTQNAIRTKWNFVVEFEDEESSEICGMIGHADTQEECEAFVEEEARYHQSRGRTIVNIEAAELCADCEGEGLIPAGNGGRVICAACGGHLGPVTPSVRWKV